MEISCAKKVQDVLGLMSAVSSLLIARFIQWTSIYITQDLQRAGCFSKFPLHCLSDGYAVEPR